LSGEGLALLGQAALPAASLGGRENVDFLAVDR